jgi:hypothetical protein
VAFVCRCPWSVSSSSSSVCFGVKLIQKVNFTKLSTLTQHTAPRFLMKAKEARTGRGNLVGPRSSIPWPKPAGTRGSSGVWWGHPGFLVRLQSTAFTRGSSFGTVELGSGAFRYRLGLFAWAPEPSAPVLGPGTLLARRCSLYEGSIMHGGKCSLFIGGPSKAPLRSCWSDVVTGHNSEHFVERTFSTW